MRSFVHLVIALALGCGSTGQREVSYPAFGSGTAARSFQAAGGWEVTLEVARVGFGPAYFCATSAASADLCPSAVAELADSATIDALSPAAQLLGEVRGVTGAIRSSIYDYAISWGGTQAEARPTRGAPSGHSAHFEGRATRDGTTIRFVADVDVLPQLRGSWAVQGARVSADVSDDQVRLDVRLDPHAWWRAVDFDGLAALSTDPVVVTRGMPAYNAVVIGMTAGAPAVLEWSRR